MVPAAGLGFVSPVCRGMFVDARTRFPHLYAFSGRSRLDFRLHSVKPGITCASKSFGRDNLSKRGTVEMDLAYIGTMSLKGDLRLLWKTCEGVLLRRDVLDGRAETLPLEDEAAQL